MKEHDDPVVLLDVAESQLYSPFWLLFFEFHHLPLALELRAQYVARIHDFRLRVVLDHIRECEALSIGNRVVPDMH